MVGKIDAPLNEKLQEIKWGEFKLGELFEILSYQKRFDANKVEILQNGDYPYIVRTAFNNGQRGFIDEDTIFLNEGNTISFGQDTATAFYQPKPYFTGDKIKVLKAKNNRFNEKNALFFVTAITKSFSQFAWGESKFDIKTLEKQIIQLPIQTNGSIDFDFIAEFVAELEAQRVAELETYLAVTGLKDYELTNNEQQAVSKTGIEWKEYTMESLFERITTKTLPYKAADLPKEITGEYTLPCLTSSFMNQGLNYYVPKEGATILKNVISIPSNSDVYRAYYQSREFTVLSDAYAIQWKDASTDVTDNQLLFMVMCINKVTDLPQYSYKNKLGGWNIVSKKNILLPTKNGKIDFEYMENFILALKKLVIKDVVQYSDNKIKLTKEVIANKS